MAMHGNQNLHFLPAGFRGIFYFARLLRAWFPAEVYRIFENINSARQTLSFCDMDEKGWPTHLKIYQMK